MSWKPEFCVSGEWCGNAVRFETEIEARRNASDKFMVWTTPTAWRAVESTDPVNYAYINRQLVEVKPCPECGKFSTIGMDVHTMTCSKA